ncbi:MAG: hypothetical protein A2498_11770 [Lentisphaerae bacterium RIFOXYC12_FULL_60_16]|nr:MAG: hypothetical protein A2498_11770 [Lentisphaerae bacterium RIFOXYC12_FULL_60_16]OGV77277.1 MAG: hypothetical protein A2340_06115 [Lentisphaerae bacterium RIFOXYB12_FULL_60_10]
MDGDSDQQSIACEGAARGPVAVVRHRSEHCISRTNIDPDALTVLYRLKQAGFDAYLVGGAVRDLLLGLHPKDFDVGTSAHPRDIRNLFRNCFLVGRRFRLAHVRFGDKVIETSTFRCEPDAGSIQMAEGGRHRDNTFGTPAEDALRRDFTINGLFYDIRSFDVIDYVGGLTDLEKRLVRCIGDPDVRFPEDPVRMMRAVRFASRFKFQIEPATYIAIERHAGEIRKAATARLLEEVYRLFAARSSEGTFRHLLQSGLMSVLMPELADFLEDSPERQDACWRLLGALDSRPPEVDLVSPEVLLGVLYHGVYTQRLRECGSEPSIHDCTETAAGVLEPFFERYQAPKRLFYSLLHLLPAIHHLVNETDPEHAGRWMNQEWARAAVVLMDCVARADHERPTAPLSKWLMALESRRGAHDHLPVHGAHPRRHEPEQRRSGPRPRA